MDRDGDWSHTSSLLRPPTNGGYLYALISQLLNDLAKAMKALDGKKRYALISQFTGSMQHATGRVERPSESQEALDGKKM